jgi:hypothetical protein
MSTPFGAIVSMPCSATVYIDESYERRMTAMMGYQNSLVNVLLWLQAQEAKTLEGNRVSNYFLLRAPP